MKAPRIFSVDDTKSAKAQGYGWLNAIHYMAPGSLSGVNLCPHATPACLAACLGWTSGQAGMVKDKSSVETQGNATRASRIHKAQLFMTQRKLYLSWVVRELEKLIFRADKEGYEGLTVRMNGSTDIAWEGISIERDGVTYRNIMEAFPTVQFIDYTKNHARLSRKLPLNYHLTLSRHEGNHLLALDAVRAGHNVAIVFDKLPATYEGLTVIDGDKHDLRHLDPRGVIVGLVPKGSAKKDTSGFVVRIAA